jgi:hypothetical protein
VLVLVRRAATWVSTVLVAIVVAFTVPVSQLRTISTIKMCCCPDPDRCHCPHPKSDTSQAPSIRPCHSTEQVMVAPQSPAFCAVSYTVAPEPVVVVALVEHSMSSPHAPPPPARPDAPS